MLVNSKCHKWEATTSVLLYVQGMLMVSPKQCSSKQALVRLWLHESMRVFHDRLVDDQDKSHFRGILLELVGKNLSSAVGSPQDLFPQDSSIIFGDFLKPGLDPAERLYEEVSLCCTTSPSDFVKGVHHIITMVLNFINKYNN